MTDPIRPADAARAGCLPRKTFDCEFKSIDERTGTFSLYAAVFGNVDRQGDIIESGAFDNLEEFVRDGCILLNHNQQDLPVGYPTAARQDAKGLYIEGCFHSTPAAQECRTILRERQEAGKANTCSVGYLSRDEAYEKQDGSMIRRIKRLSIYEGSFVNIPANPQAHVQQVKSAQVPTPTPSTPEGQSMAQETTPQGAEIVQALKDFLLELKGDMPKSGHTRLKAFAEQMHEHGCKTKEHAKEMHEHGKSACEMAKCMKSFLKDYKPSEADVDEPAEDDEAGPDDEEARPKKSRKEAEPEDTADGEPPKGRKRESEEEKTRKAWRDQLRTRALVGRRTAVCP